LIKKFIKIKTKNSKQKEVIIKQKILKSNNGKIQSKKKNKDEIEIKHKNKIK
jgi:hypothetical protein